MRRCVIKEGTVINVIEIEENITWDAPKGAILGPEGGEIGDSYDGKDYIAPMSSAIPDEPVIILPD
jgi:hypothetical protein